MDQIDLSELENPNAIPEPEEPDNPFDPKSPNTGVGNEEEPQPDLSNEDPILRGKKIYLLQSYFKNFPEKLEMYQGVNYTQMSMEQIDAFQAEIDVVLNSESTVNQYVGAFQGGLLGLEQFLTSFTPVKATNLHVLGQNKDLIDDVKLWTLMNIDVVQTKPETRIAMHLIQAIGKLHVYNSQVEAKGELDRINNEFSDL
jgi:hypothetical protein